MADRDATVAPEPPSAAEEPLACTGWAASWCPVHGRCLCPRWADGERIGDGDDPEVARCPLHRDGSHHATPEAEPPPEQPEATHGCICYDPDEVDAERAARKEAEARLARLAESQGLLESRAEMAELARKEAERRAEVLEARLADEKRRHAATIECAKHNSNVAAEAERQRDEALRESAGDALCAAMLREDIAKAEAEVAALREALERERASVVAWLRSGIVSESCDDDYDRADAIERGDHAALAAHPQPAPTTEET